LGENACEGKSSSFFFFSKNRIICENVPTLSFNGLEGLLAVPHHSTHACGIVAELFISVGFHLRILTSTLSNLQRVQIYNATINLLLSPTTPSIDRPSLLLVPFNFFLNSFISIFFNFSDNINNKINDRSFSNTYSFWFSYFYLRRRGGGD
jgi:hypothetical protein